MENKYRKDFPFFKAIDENEAGENKGLIYFDTAATAQRPFIVLNAMTHFYATENANPLRGLYSLSERATMAYENARDTVAKFINAREAAEIVFTRNASESLNLVAYSWGLNNLKEGDEICVSIMEHHSNIVPWQMVCKKTGAKLVFLECDKETGIISDEEIASKIGPRTKIVSIVHVSNVLGVTNPVKKLGEAAHAVGAIFIVDGAQSAPHMKVDVQEINADFFAMSGHKLCGPMGIGALYGKRALLEEMDPFLRGGEMIEYVTREKATWAEVPHKFEAGTVNAAGAVGLAAAIDYITEIGLHNIEERELELTRMAFDGMKSIPHVIILGGDKAEDHHGIITFKIEGVHPHDIAAIIADANVAVRAGHHCAEPLHQFMGIPSTTRASLMFYNTEDEVQRLIDIVRKIRPMMGYPD